MLGAGIGDIAESAFEFDNIKSRDFGFINNNSWLIDDSVMTFAVELAILACHGDYQTSFDGSHKGYEKIGLEYSYCGYGGYFRKYILKEGPQT
jgi:type I restriction enzyme M protein